MTGSVVSVNISQEKEEPKVPVGKGVFKVGIGVVGDAHAGMPMEVSLLSIERTEELMQETGEEFTPGSFAENLTIRGFPTKSLKVGDRLKVGEVILEVVQIGKPRGSHHTYNYKGHSLLPTYGIFANIVSGGVVSPGDDVSKQA